MTKKSFKKGFSGLLGEEESLEQLSPNTQTSSLKKIKKSAEKRATFIVNTSHLESLKAIAFWERKMLKDILFSALNSYIKEYEKENGDIKLPDNN